MRQRVTVTVNRPIIREEQVHRALLGDGLDGTGTRKVRIGYEGVKHEIEVFIDVDQIIAKLGRKACENLTGKCNIARGLIQVRRISPKKKALS